MIVANSLFEGTEKKLEIILTAPIPGLRHADPGLWHRVVDAAGAAVVSHMATEAMDAFLLSESSLFVWEDRILMITCGQTAPARALPLIVDAVGIDRVGLVFYERKNLLFPEEQPLNFATEVAGIERQFPGRHYRFGTPAQDHVHLFVAGPGLATPGCDVTFQMLMHDLPAWSMGAFANPPQNADHRDALVDAFHRLVPQMKTDHHFFSPRGFSLNAATAEDYFTVHVTPQSVGSYVSVESNAPSLDRAHVIATMATLLKPGRFSLVLTASNAAADATLGEDLATRVSSYETGTVERRDLGCGYANTFLTAIAPGTGVRSIAERGQ